MRAVCDDATYLQHMLDFEAALARAEAATGRHPRKRGWPDRDGLQGRSVRSRRAGRGRDAVRQSRDPARQGAHRRCRQGRRRGRALRALGRHQPGRDRYRRDADLARGASTRCWPDIDRAIAGFAKLARQHRNTAVVARTWLQHALPMPFGLKLAEYAAALHRSRARLQRLRRETLALQFGGAAGTLAALGDKGWRVAEKLAQELELPLPDAPWHTHRDRIAEAASVLAILAGTCGKIARDVSLMMQTDVAEAFEPSGEGRGGSSTMPHKRNPVAAATALAAATMAPNLAATISQPRCRITSAAPGLARGMADVAEPAAGHVGRARRHCRYRRRPRSRCRAHARQSRRHRRADHGRSGDDGAGGKDRQERGASSGGGREQKGRRREERPARRADRRYRRSPRISSAGKIAKLFEPMAYQGVSQTLIDRLLASLDDQ